MARRKGVQLNLELGQNWGGARKGAGRKPRDPAARRNVPHTRRPAHNARHPTLVTLRARSDVGSLRDDRIMESLRDALWRQSRRPYSTKFHVVDFSIQNDHVHLTVEGQDPKAADPRAILRSGLTGLASSLARLINKKLGRSGSVWADRHHRRDLKTPTDVRNALVYTLQNWKRHGTVVFGDTVDPYSSASRFPGWSEPPEGTTPSPPWPAAKPRTWLLRAGWMRAKRKNTGRLLVSEGPASTAPLADVVQKYLYEELNRDRPGPSRTPP